MFDQILSVGEKIKKLRDEAKLTQEDLAGDTITREFLSLLENNKRKLKHDIADFLARKLYKELVEQGKYFAFTISAKSLMESEKAQAINLINVNIKNSFNEEKIINLLDIALKYKLNKHVIDLSIIAADYFYDIGDYFMAIEYAQKGLYPSAEDKNIHKYIQLNTKIIKSSLEIKNFKDALVRSKNILAFTKINGINDVHILNNIYYNFAVIYNELKEFDLAIDYAYKVNTQFLNKTQSIDLKTVIANCYLDSDDLDNAIKQYKKILRYNLDDEQKSRTYRNLAECYYKNNMKLGAQKYIEICLDIRRNIKSNYLSQTLNFASNIYKDLKNIDRAEACLIEALEISQNNGILEKLIDMYIEQNNLLKITILVDKHLDNLNTNTLIKLSKLYLYKNICMTEKFLCLLSLKNIKN